MNDSNSVGKQLSFSDRLAIALGCLAAVMALSLVWVDRTPMACGLTTVAMVALMVYPILHFFSSWKMRVPLMILVCAAIGLFSWKVWPRTGSAPPVVVQAPLPHQNTPAAPAPAPVTTNSQTTHRTLKPKKLVEKEPAVPQVVVSGPVTQTSQGDCSPNIVGNGNVNNCNPPPPPLPEVRWNVKNIDTNAPGAYMVTVSISIKNRMPSPVLALVCDKPCVSVSFRRLSTSGGVLSTSIFNSNANTVGVRVDIPSAFEDGTNLDWQIESKDGEPFTILDVARANLKH